MKGRVLVAAASKARAKELASFLAFLPREIDLAAGWSRPADFDSYRLLICEIGGKLKNPTRLLSRLRRDAQVVLSFPDLDLRCVSQYLQDPRVSHFLGGPLDRGDLVTLVEKLETGEIFGLERYLPANAAIYHRRLSTFKERCNELELIEQVTREHGIRNRQRLAIGRVAEELLMNAMYQAPVDRNGERIFGKADQRDRIREHSPNAVSLRYAVDRDSGTFYLSVRDRYGSFRREDLAHYLLRCAAQEQKIEEKKLGAGLGLYVIASSVTKLVINILPGVLAELVCVFAPQATDDPLRLLSVTTLRATAK